MIHPVRDVVVISYFQRSFGKLVVELNRIGEYVQGIIKLYHEKNQWMSQEDKALWQYTNIPWTMEQHEEVVHPYTPSHCLLLYKEI